MKKKFLQFEFISSPLSNTCRVFQIHFSDPPHRSSGNFGYVLKFFFNYSCLNVSHPAFFFCFRSYVLGAVRADPELFFDFEGSISRSSGTRPQDPLVSSNLHCCIGLYISKVLSIIWSLHF